MNNKTNTSLTSLASLMATNWCTYQKGNNRKH